MYYVLFFNISERTENIRNKKNYETEKIKMKKLILKLSFRTERLRMTTVERNDKTFSFFGILIMI